LWLPGVVHLHETHPGGLRLRLPHGTDAEDLRALCARHRVSCDPEALLRHDPREMAVVCAVRLEGPREHLVGVGSIPLRAGASPDVLVADDDGTREHLRRALTARLHARPRRRRDHGVRRVLRRARSL
jgi:hypothetical protein